MSVSVNVDELQQLVINVANSSQNLNDRISEIQSNILTNSASTNIKSITSSGETKSLNKFNESFGKILSSFHDQIIMDLQGIEEGINIVKENEQYIKGNIEEGR